MASTNTTQKNPTGTNPDPSLKKKREDFHFGKILGEGSYSTVVLAKENATQREYAMKILIKQHIIREKKVPYVSREKEVMKMTNHPFIVRLGGERCSPQGEWMKPDIKQGLTLISNYENYFLIPSPPSGTDYGLSYDKRGELLQYIIKLGSFDEECTRFYSAELIVALEYLHGLGIIHRDLKPENILLSEDMHIKLADFGTAKILNTGRSAPNSERANSFVGTAQYVSPELLSEKVCYKSSDLWALGCIIYQLLAGRPPFRATNEYLIFQKIIKLEYSFPEGFLPSPKDVVSNLLILDPKKRIGCDEMGGYEHLRSHTFYSGIHFDTLHTADPPKLKLYLPSNDPGQPGFSDEVDITALMNKDDELDEWELDRFNITDKNNAIMLPSDEEKQKAELEKQRNESIWHPFVDGHLILKMGIIDKRKGLFAKRRQFLLTEGPGLYYVDPQAMVLKGKIPWTRELRPEVKNFRIFFIHTPHRTYYLEDPDSRATEWVKVIGDVHKRYFGS